MQFYVLSSLAFINSLLNVVKRPQSTFFLFYESYSSCNLVPAVFEARFPVNRDTRDAMPGKNTTYIISKETHSDDITNFSTRFEVEISFSAMAAEKQLFQAASQINCTSETDHYRDESR
jgi:hypothetical protein